MVRGKSPEQSKILFGYKSVTQGCYLAIFVYTIYIVSIAENLKRDTPQVIQIWYTNNFLFWGTVAKYNKTIQQLENLDNDWDYLLNLYKYKILIKIPDKFVTGHKLSALEPVLDTKYLGGYLRPEKLVKNWFLEKVETWTSGIKTFSKIVRHEPQCVYADIFKTLLPEWNYIQRVTRDAGQEFDSVEQALAEDFVPTIFRDEQSDLIRDLVSMTIKDEKFSITDPTKTAVPLNACLIVSSKLIVENLSELNNIDTQ